MNDSEHWAHVDELARPIDTDTRQLVEEACDWLAIATGVMLWVVTVLGAVFAHHMMSAWVVGPK